ncbi:MAG: hypothetical protein V4805_07740 [Pseudomonadota bacterium]
MPCPSNNATTSEPCMHNLRRALLLLSLAIVLIATWLVPPDAAATRQVDAGLKRALISFATARALNALISVAQGTEVGIQPAGVGLTFTPGQALQPINDLVGQFASLMLAASVAFGVQRALIEIGAYWPMSALLSVVLLAWAWARWSGQRRWDWLTRLLLFLLLLRFAVPIISLGNEAAYQSFLAQEYTAGQTTMEKSTGHFIGAGEPVVESPPPDESILDRLKRWQPKAPDLKKRFEALREAADRVVEHIVRLIVVFLLQTLVLPLLMLWAMLRLSRALYESSRLWRRSQAARS